MQNKFLQFPKESPKYEGQNSRSVTSLNRFEALVGGGSAGAQKLDSLLPHSASLPALLPATPTQQAMQRHIESKFKDLRKRAAPKKQTAELSKACFLDNGSNFRTLKDFISTFRWEAHLGKLENLWFSVLGNPTKFIFILLDYFEECFSQSFPSISFTQANWMDELPIEALGKNPTPSQALLLSDFQGQIAEPIEGFLRMKLESPEFKIEDVFTALLEIVVKCQRLKDGQNSFASILVLSTLARIFPFQALLSLRELLSCRGLSLHQQGFFFMWFAGVIFEEEPSQSGVLVEVVLEEIASQPSSLPNAVLLGALQLLEDFLRETIALHSSNAALLVEYQVKLLELATSNPTVSKLALQTIWMLSLSLLSPALCKLESTLESEFLLSKVFEIACKEPKVLEFAALLAENWPQSFVRCFLGGPQVLYEQFLASSSRSFLLMLKPATHSILIRALDEHTKALSAPNAKWTGSVAQRSGAARRDAVNNAAILADLSQGLSSRGGSRGQPMKSSRGILGRKGSLVLFFVVLVVASVLAVLFSPFRSKRIDDLREIVAPWTSQLAALTLQLKQKVHEWHPHVNRASQSLVLYGKQAVEKYRPVVQTVSKRCLDGALSLVRVYAGPSALRAYRERAGAVLEWVRQLRQ